MNARAEFDHHSSAVQTHLTIMQGVIARMGSSSRSCKTWGLIVTAVILILGGGIGKFDFPWIAYVPVLLFLGLDLYYLGLERRFRASYNLFLEKLRAGSVAAADLYEVAPAGSPIGYWLNAVRSPSIWPFYLMLIGVITVAVWQID